MSVPRVSDPKAALAMREAEELRARGGLRLRLLICDTCLAVWPTERDPSHGGSRQDGEPCAYDYKGRVCKGHVNPMNGRTYARDARFDDYEAAKPGDAPKWYVVLGVAEHATLSEVRARYRSLAKTMHPDQGGDADEMVKVNVAYAEALSVLGQPLGQPEVKE